MPQEDAGPSYEDVMEQLQRSVTDWRLGNGLAPLEELTALDEASRDSQPAPEPVARPWELPGASLNLAHCLADLLVACTTGNQDKLEAELIWGLKALQVYTPHLITPELNWIAGLQTTAVSELSVVPQPTTQVPPSDGMPPAAEELSDDPRDLSDRWLESVGLFKNRFGNFLIPGGTVGYYFSRCYGGRLLFITPLAPPAEVVGRQFVRNVLDTLPAPALADDSALQPSGKPE